MTIRAIRPFPMKSLRQSQSNEKLLLKSLFMMLPILIINIRGGSRWSQIDTVVTRRAEMSLAKTSTRLVSGKDFTKNLMNVSYWADLTVEPNVGRTCMKFGVDDDCTTPYFQVRLSGAAMVMLELDEDTLYGCVDLPVAGRYMIEANILSCSLNTKIAMTMTHNEILEQCIIHPDVNSTFVPYEFDQERFVRKDSKQKTSYWVYAPSCHSFIDITKARTRKQKREWAAELSKRNSNCTLFAGTPRYVPTKYQLNEMLPKYGWNGWEDRKEYYRYDDYVWLPVNHKNGEVYYDEPFATPEYAPPPPGVGSIDQQLCFVGDSHARYLYHEVHWISNNHTLSGDACVHKIFDETKAIHPRFRYISLRFSDEWLIAPESHKEQLRECSRIVLSYGHWEAGWPRENVTLPKEFGEGVIQVVSSIRNYTSAPIWLLSLNLVPLGYKSLQCPATDWRTAPIVHAYNQVLRRQAEAIFVDNSDMNDPLWDSAMDYVHPCRNVFRPMALRLLQLILNYSNKAVLA